MSRVHLLRWFRERRRDAIRRQHFPRKWRDILFSNVHLLRRLSSDRQETLIQNVAILLNEKRFEGGGGLCITDEIRVTILGHAALLLFGPGSDYFRRLYSIVVYPSRFGKEQLAHEGGGVVSALRVFRRGESWRHGFVVLAWDAVLNSMPPRSKWSNVVLHEFAHQLDYENGATDGTPRLVKETDNERWKAVFESAFARLRRRKDAERVYAATNAAEFFAVMTEYFFARPTRLKRTLPDVYDLLAAFHGLDLASEVGDWTEGEEEMNDVPA
jgi:MtfA peptidase